MMNFKKNDFLCALVVAGAVVFLSSCTVGPDYVKPSAEIPVSYKEMSQWKKARPQDNIIKGRWWEIYKDHELNALEEQVNISNQNIAQAEAQFRVAQALVREARAGYFPTVTAGASAVRSRSKVTSGKGSSATSFPIIASDYTLPVDVSWAPDVWGRVRRTVEASRANAQASEADLEGARLSVQSSLAQDYFQLRSLDADKQLLESSVSSYRKFLELTKNQYSAGVVSRASVLQAETQLKTTEAQAIDVGVQRAQLEHAIALLVGKPASDFSIPVSPLAAVPPQIPAGIPSELLERRPDIAAAERLMAAANAQIGVAEAAFYPDITLSASGGFQSPDITRWLTWPSRFWSVGSSLSETVFEGGLLRAQSDQARAAYDASVASYRQTVLTAFQEVEDNLAALRILEHESEVQDEVVKAAQQSVTLTTNQYKAGTASAIEVIVTQTAELSNEKTAIDLMGRRMTASALLIAALGGGWNASELR